MRNLINVLDICEMFDLELSVKYIQQAVRGYDKWGAHFYYKGGPVGILLSDGAWTSFVGYGNNPQEAIENLVKESSGKKLCLSSIDNKEIRMPNNLFIEY